MGGAPNNPVPDLLAKAWTDFWLWPFTATARTLRYLTRRSR